MIESMARTFVALVFHIHVSSFCYDRKRCTSFVALMLHARSAFLIVIAMYVPSLMFLIMIASAAQTFVALVFFVHLFMRSSAPLFPDSYLCC